MAVDLGAQINSAADPENMTDLEKKHTPVVCVPDDAQPGQCATVTVEVGKLLAHPNELDHFIGRVELFENGVLLAAANLSPVTSCPTVTFCVNCKGSGKVTARAWCNMHGVWESEVCCGGKC